MMRIAICFDRFGPYHLARLESATGRNTVLGVEFNAETADYAWDKVVTSASFSRITLFDGSRAASTREIRRRIAETLDQFKPEAVAISGWGTREALATLEWCLERQCPAILMSESQASDEVRVFWKEAIKRRLVALFSGALVGGVSHAEYLVELGMHRKHVHLGYDVVDNAHFEHGAEEARKAAEMWRNKLGLPRQYFLSSARFIPKKNLPRLLSAYAAYRESAGADGWDLVLLGDGPLRPDLEKLRRDLGMERAIHLPGFQQYPVLPAYYGLARVFIHASTTEQWGLVVNEAMAAGLPVLVSSQCGCADELVRDARNGFRFDPEDVNGLAQRMLSLGAMTSALPGMGDKSREIIAHWSPDRFGEGMEDAARVGLSSQRPTGNVFDRALLGALLRR